MLSRGDQVACNITLEPSRQTVECYSVHFSFSPSSGIAFTIADRFHDEPISVFQVVGVVASLLAAVVILDNPRASSGSGRRR
jgi:hypothetical protein